MVTSSYAQSKGWKESTKGCSDTSDELKKEVIQIEAVTSIRSCPTIKMNADNTLCKEISISGCTFYNVIRAIGHHSLTTGVVNGKTVTISNNNFTNVIGSGIVLPNIKDFKISLREQADITHVHIHQMYLRLLHLHLQIIHITMGIRLSTSILLITAAE